MSKPSQPTLFDHQNVSILDFIGAKNGGGLEVMVITADIRRAKLQSNDHHQQTNTQHFTGWMSFLLPNQLHQSTKCTS